MFNSITTGFLKMFDSLRSKKFLDKSSMEEVVFNVKRILLDSDVSIDLINKICQDLEINILELKLSKSGISDRILYTLYKILYDVLKDSVKNNKIKINETKTNIFMLIGTQGSGKTSFCGKLGYDLRLNNPSLKIACISFDFSRPAAYEQLRYGCDKARIDFIEHDKSFYSAKNELKIAVESGLFDAVIIDTSGKSSFDADNIAEIEKVNQIYPCDNLILVLDSMSGRGLNDIANYFLSHFDVNGLVFTKTDSDSKGGSIFNLSYLTKKPIFYISEGEKFDDISKFNPDLFVKKLLAIGDISEMKLKAFDGFDDRDSLGRISSGKFNFIDIYNHFKTLSSSNNIKKITSLMPGSSKIKNQVKNIDISLILSQMACINSMTQEERLNPEILLEDSKNSQSRIDRISKGAKVDKRHIVDLIKKTYEMRLFFSKSTNSSSF